MEKVTFEKDGKSKSVVGDKENIKCMELAGWKQIDVAPIANITKPDIVVAHEVSRRGRPRKEESAPVEVSDDGHSTEFN